MINVTKTYIPNEKKFKYYVDQILESGWLTNNGCLARELQKKLDNYLNVNNTVLVSNGTSALQVSYKLLGLTGEIITTPFSFVATTSSIVWEGLTPVFVDIDENTYCIDPKKIEEKINSNTTAIVATHVFGNACDIDAIENIAKKYKLKVIYDAAHSFGILYKGKSIYSYGDVSIASFHSTKIFHTIEGGAIFANEEKLFQKVKKMINFGITGPESIEEIGINAKLNEFEAAMGLCLLDEMEENLSARARVYNIYQEHFINYDQVKLQNWNKECTLNYSYFPILFKSENIVLEVIDALSNKQIYPRRYFYPSLDRLPYVNSEFMEISSDISQRILCLPLYGSLSYEDQLNIISTIKGVID